MWSEQRRGCSDEFMAVVGVSEEEAAQMSEQLLWT